MLRVLPTLMPCLIFTPRPRDKGLLTEVGKWGREGALTLNRAALFYL